MTPAIDKAKKAGITFFVHEYEHDSTAESYGMEAAEKLKIVPERVFKTLVVGSSAKDLTVAVLPVSKQLDMKLMAKAIGVKKVGMADVGVVERVTGYVVGGVSPLGQKKQLKTVIDASAEEYETIFVSGGRRGVDIELSPYDLATLTRASFASVAK